MNVSISYINMCVNATDLLKHRWNKELGDYYYNHSEEVVSMISHSNNFNNLEIFWLPKLDQLFDIWRNENRSPSAWNVLRYAYMRTATDEKGLNAYYIAFDSLEEVVLAFLMREMYGKRWNSDTKSWEKEL